MIIGISGKKFSGKDTTANIIKKEKPFFEITHFADPIKKCLSDVFDIDILYFNEPSLKEIALDYPIDIDTYLSKLSSYLSIPLNNHSKIAYTPRQLMQYVGTEYVREVNDLYWINKTISDNKHNEDLIISDVRFNPEVSAIKNLNGIIVNIELVGKDIAYTDNHKSENESFPFDYELLNVFNKRECLYYQVVGLLKVLGV